jgi:multidrug resistance efflux pump
MQISDNPIRRPAHSCETQGLVSLLVGRKMILSMAIAAAVGFVPLQGLLQTSSAEAVINARVTTLRAPIDGEVQLGPSPLAFGTSVARGDVLLRITNRRADLSRVDDLSHQIEQLKDERSGIAVQLANARTLLNDLTEQTRLFADARVLQLEARKGELEAEFAAAGARTDEAKTSLDRLTTLASKGWLPRAQLNRATRDGLVAEKLEAAAQRRLEAVGIELAAAQRGVFVGAGNNDRPRYMQRVDQLQQQVSNLADALAERDQRMIRLNDKLVEEKVRFNALPAAEVIASAKGSVWEILTAPDEPVHRGQGLLRVLDCSEPVVTAVVSETVSSRIQVGSPVRFRPRDSREELPGKVTHLSAASNSPANLAIPSSALTLGSYHVTVVVPKLSRGCPIGRTGRVFFDDVVLEPSLFAAGDGIRQAFRTALEKPFFPATDQFRFQGLETAAVVSHMRAVHRAKSDPHRSRNLWLGQAAFAQQDHLNALDASQCAAAPSERA